MWRVRSGLKFQLCLRRILFLLLVSTFVFFSLKSPVYTSSLAPLRSVRYYGSFYFKVPFVLLSKHCWILQWNAVIEQQQVPYTQHSNSLKKERAGHMSLRGGINTGQADMPCAELLIRNTCNCLTCLRHPSLNFLPLRWNSAEPHIAAYFARAVLQELILIRPIVRGCLDFRLCYKNGPN